MTDRRPFGVPLRARALPAQPCSWGRPRRGPSRPPPIYLVHEHDSAAGIAAAALASAATLGRRGALALAALGHAPVDDDGGALRGDDHDQPRQGGQGFRGTVDRPSLEHRETAPPLLTHAIHRVLRLAGDNGIGKTLLPPRRASRSDTGRYWHVHEELPGLHASFCQLRRLQSVGPGFVTVIMVVVVVVVVTGWRMSVKLAFPDPRYSS
jgi:hypothetical protein